MSAQTAKERPILFSGPMVAAILAGAKTQTRRVMSPQPEWLHLGGAVAPGINGGNAWVDAIVQGDERLVYCPFGTDGDRLWVRESFRTPEELDMLSPSEAYSRETALDARAWPPTLYEADGEVEGSHDELETFGIDTDGNGWGRLRPSIHMPRSLSRLTLEITDVRAEPVQEISHEDSIAEGCPDEGGPGVGDLIAGPYSYARTRFAALWDSINGKRPGCSWADNPWVWAVSFAVKAPAASGDDL